PALAAANDRRLGGDHHTIAWHRLDRLADNVLGAIGRCGVEQVNAVIEGRMDDGDCTGLGATGGQSEPAEPAAAEARDTDLDFCPAQRGIFHPVTCLPKAERLSRRSIWREADAA